MLVVQVLQEDLGTIGNHEITSEDGHGRVDRAGSLLRYCLGTTDKWLQNKKSVFFLSYQCSGL